MGKLRSNCSICNEFHDMEHPHPSVVWVLTIIGVGIILQIAFLILKCNDAEGLTLWGAAAPTFGVCIAALLMATQYSIRSYAARRAAKKRGS